MLKHFCMDKTILWEKYTQNHAMSAELCKTLRWLEMGPAIHQEKLCTPLYKRFNAILVTHIPYTYISLPNDGLGHPLPDLSAIRPRYSRSNELFQLGGPGQLAAPAVPGHEVLPSYPVTGIRVLRGGEG